MPIPNNQRVPRGGKKPPTPKPPTKGGQRKLGGPTRLLGIPSNERPVAGSGINDLVYRGPKVASKLKKQAVRPVRTPKKKPATRGSKYGRGML